jgi:class 3 adenylate cyclase
LPWLPREFPPEEGENIRAGWGRGILLSRLAPDEARDPAIVQAFAAYERQSASPGTGQAMLKMLYDGDVRAVLPAIRVPTLVIAHSQSARIPIEHSRYVADHIPGARYVELPGNENLPWAGDQQRLLAEMQEFVTGVRPREDADRVLATVLFTDIVRSTEHAAELGDRSWTALLDEHHTLVRAELERFRGNEIRTVGDGVLATFDGPARAIRCACAIRDAVHRLGIEIRAGLHTGEIELSQTGIEGLAVHLGARIAALAARDEVLVSSTVKDLVFGSGIEFEARGAYELKGVPGEWQVYLVTSAG